METKIGFIGQGWIGKNYANDFEARGLNVIRYAQENPYVQNKDKIRDCDIVFVAVPTPSTPEGFDYSILEEVLLLIGDGKTAVIKSTLLPGTTRKLQEKYPNITVLHSPEFLTEVDAAYDASHPKRNIIGYTHGTDGDIHYDAAKKVMTVLPEAPFKEIVIAETAELIKYGGNCWFYFKVLYMNMLYDLANKLDIDYERVKDAMSYDPRIGFTHLDPIHKSGRGAGGHCFIKDFAAFTEIFKKELPEDSNSIAILEALETKNIELLKNSNKDIDLLKGVYGDKI